MLKLDGLTVGYNGTAAAGPLFYEYPDGVSVMLRGRNGGGKSTLMKTVAGLLKPVGGSFSTDGEVVMVPTRIPKVKGFTIKEFILTGMQGRTGLFGKVSRQDKEAVEQALGRLGLSPLADKDISGISDGEFQKACIAMALTRKADVILLDEPTAFLDVDNRVAILRLLREVARSTEATVMFSTHDIHDGALFADFVLNLDAPDETIHKNNP